MPPAGCAVSTASTARPRVNSRGCADWLPHARPARNALRRTPGTREGSQERASNGGARSGRPVRAHRSLAQDRPPQGAPSLESHPPGPQSTAYSVRTAGSESTLRGPAPGPRSRDSAPYSREDPPRGPLRHVAVWRPGRGCRNEGETPPERPPPPRRPAAPPRLGPPATRRVERGQHPRLRHCVSPPPPRSQPSQARAQSAARSKR